MTPVQNNVMTQKHWDLLRQLKAQKGRDFTEAEIDAVLASGDTQSIIAKNSVKTRRACQNTQSVYSRIKKRIVKAAAIGLTSTVAFNVVPQLETLEGRLNTKQAVTNAEAQTQDPYVMNEMTQHLRTSHRGVYNGQFFRFINDDTMKVCKAGTYWVDRKRVKISESNDTITQAFDAALYYLSEGQNNVEGGNLLENIVTWQVAKGMTSLEPGKKLIDLNGDADKIIETYLRDNPRSAELTALVAYKYATKGDRTRVDQLTQQALSLGSNNEEVYWTLAQTYGDLKDKESMMNMLYEGLKRIPNSEKFHKQLGGMYDDKDKKLYHYRKALEINPNNETIRRNIEFWSKKN